MRDWPPSQALPSTERKTSYRFQPVVLDARG